MISEDTICAVSTPSGVGGIAVIRVSGPKAVYITDSVWRGKSLADVKSHTAHFGVLYDPADGSDLDQAVAVVFRAPRSFTGEDVVELSVHGSRWIQRELLNLLVRSGCRIADPGEFTRRAFASGKMDLAEAEAVADVIASSSKASHRVAMAQIRGDLSKRLGNLHDRLLDLASLLELELDFSEEEVEFASRERLVDLAGEVHDVVAGLAASFATGQAIKDGVPVTIAGETNAGKSTLLNALLQEQRAIVSDIHGTTRDAIEDTVEIGGVLFRITDTAGLRETDDPIETLGIELARNKINSARIVLWVIDASADEASLSQRWTEICGYCGNSDTRIIVLINKSDIVPAVRIDVLRDRLASILPESAIVKNISAHTGNGLPELKQILVDASGVNALDEDAVMVTNVRHYAALASAEASSARVLADLKDMISADLIAQDIRETLHHLATITGTITSDDILATIFSRFCIGK